MARRRPSHARSARCGSAATGGGPMGHELVVLPDSAALANRAAELVTALAKSTITDRGRFTFAVSGGHTPWAMFAKLMRQDVAWKDIQIFQVDERVAPD